MTSKNSIFKKLEYMEGVVENYLAETCYESFWTVVSVSPDEPNKYINYSCEEERECYGDLAIDLNELYSPFCKLRLFIHTPPHRKIDDWWIDWVINKSFLSHVFLTKDPKSCSFEIDLDHSYTEILAGLILHRRTREMYNPILPIDKHSITPLEYFILTEVFTHHIDGRWCWKEHESDHNLLDSDANISGLFSLDRMFFDQPPHKYYNRGTTNNFSRLLGHTKPDKIRDFLYEVFHQNCEAIANMWGDEIHSLKLTDSRLKEVLNGMRRYY